MKWTYHTIFKRFALFGAFLALWYLIIGCSPKIVEKIVYETRDSIITKIDTIPVELAPVYIKDYTSLGDTLHLDTEYASARAWVNPELELLEGDIKSNPKPIYVPVPTHEEYHQKDSIIIKEVPVEVEKVVKKTPRWCWWLLGLNLLVLAGVALRIYLKLKRVGK